MRPIYEAPFGLIDITYHCGRECVYCTRCDRHLGHRRYHMSLEEIENALDSYKGFQGLVGIIGGEPLAHPQFKEVCKLIRSKYPSEKMHLFTSIDWKNSRHEQNIIKTFKHIAYHPHTPEQEAEHLHQPMTIAIKDAVKNVKLREALVEGCPLQRKWCPTITKDGAFFCEAGASIARLMGVKGWEVKQGWWIRQPENFGYQKDICNYCGMAIPMKRQKMCEKKQKISPSFLKILQDNRLPVGDYELFDREITVEEMKEAVKTWAPLIYKDEQLAEQFPWCIVDLDKYVS